MKRHSILGVFGSLAIALGLLFTSGVGPVAAGGCYVVADLPSNGSWGVYGWYMYHHTTDLATVTATLNDNVTGGMYVGLRFSDAITFNSWPAGQVGTNKTVVVQSGNWRAHPTGRQPGQTGGDLHWQADYWNLSWNG